MRVIHFHRKPRKDFYSIENIYSNIRKELKHRDGVEVRKVVMPFTCKTHVGKMLNILYSAFFFADIYHITGDIHYVSLFLPKNKTMISVHSVEGGREGMKDWRRKLFKYLYFILPSKKCKQWTVVSNYTKSELLNYINIGSSNVEVVYNPLLFLTDENKGLIRNKKIEILSVGTHPRKNLIRIIESIRGMDVVLHLIGNVDSNLLSLLLEFKIKYRITVKASMEEMKNIYKNSTLLLMPSLNESFGMPIIEAQALGVPVVTSLKTAMPEICGDGGLIVNPENVQEIRSAVQQVLEKKELRRGLINKGFQNVGRFQLDKITNQYFNLYHSMYNR